MLDLIAPQHTSLRDISGVFENDDALNSLYPEKFRRLAAKHWTPLHVSQYAAEFLASEKDVHVLDIGAGIGKFCLAAAYKRPNALFYGIEQRKELADCALESAAKVGLSNVTFMHGNFTQLDFRQFDHFYFYNSFYENLVGSDRIDDRQEHSLSLFNYYNRYLFKQLEIKPPGTRIATFHSLEGEIPPGYYTVKTYLDGLLKFWVKV